MIQKQKTEGIELLLEFAISVHVFDRGYLLALAVWGAIMCIYGTFCVVGKSTSINTSIRRRKESTGKAESAVI